MIKFLIILILWGVSASGQEKLDSSNVVRYSDLKNISIYRKAGTDSIFIAWCNGGKWFMYRDSAELRAPGGPGGGISASDTASMLAVYVRANVAAASYAALSHNHAAGDVNSGTFGDARIAASNVTQHKAALGLTGTNSGDQTITLTSDVTGSGTGSFATTIANNAVTNAKAAQMAANTIKGNNTAGTANAADLTVAQVKTLLAIVQSDIPNLVSDLAAKQASDADLTTIAGITPSNDGIMQVKSSAWTIRTPAQVKTDLALVKGDVGLGNVDNTSDASKPVSTATQTALDLKSNLASPTFTGTPAAPTPAFGTNTTQVATTAFVLAQDPTFARVTGSNATTTGQALTNITGLSVALAINAVYQFEANLSVSTSAVTTGVQYGVNYSVAGGTIEAGVIGSLTSTAAKAERISALNTATSAFLTTSAQSGVIRIQGVIATGANAGNLTIQHLKVTSGTSTVFINSYLMVKRIQ